MEQRSYMSGGWCVWRNPYARTHDDRWGWNAYGLRGREGGQAATALRARELARQAMDRLEQPFTQPRARTQPGASGNGTANQATNTRQIPSRPPAAVAASIER